MAKMRDIYRLDDKKTGLPIYIGKSKNAKKRFNQHKSAATAKNCNKKSSLHVHREIVKHNIDFDMTVITRIDVDIQKDAEYAAIVNVMTQPNDLKNVKLGDKNTQSKKFDKAKKDAIRIKQLGLRDYNDLKEHDENERQEKLRERVIEQVKRDSRNLDRETIIEQDLTAEIVRLEQQIDRLENSEENEWQHSIESVERQVASEEIVERELTKSIASASELRRQRTVDLISRQCETIDTRTKGLRESIREVEVGRERCIEDSFRESERVEDSRIEHKIETIKRSLDNQSTEIERAERVISAEEANELRLTASIGELKQVLGRKESAIGKLTVEELDAEIDKRVTEQREIGEAIRKANEEERVITRRNDKPKTPKQKLMEIALTRVLTQPEMDILIGYNR